MVKLEQLEFENEEKFMDAIKKLLKGEDAFRSYTDKDNQVKRNKIISKHRLYLGNNYSIGAFKTDKGKIYFSIDYFSIEDRFQIAKNKKTI